MILPDALLNAAAAWLPGIFIGAWTGYITNDIALRMIFKAYGPARFRFGGVIPKTRAAFTQGLIDLVNTELIRPEILREQIQKPAFTDAAVRCLKGAARRVLSSAGRHETLSGYLAHITAAGGMEEDKASAWLRDVLFDTLSQDCGGLADRIIKSAGASLPADDDFYSYLVREFTDSSDFIAARGEFMESCGGLRVKTLFGDRFYSEIKDNILYAFDGVAGYPGVELRRQTGEFAKVASYLIFDDRIVNRFCEAEQGKTVAELLGTGDFSRWEAFCRQRADLLKRDEKRGGGVNVFAGLIYDFAKLRQFKTCDIVQANLKGLDAGLKSVYSLMAGLARGLMDRRRGELSSMMEKSIEYGLAGFGESDAGVAAYARKVMFTDSVDKFDLFERFYEFVVKSCAGLSGKHNIENTVRDLMDREVSDIKNDDGLISIFGGGQNDTTQICAEITAAAAAAIGRAPAALAGIKPAQILGGLDGDERGRLAMRLALTAGAAVEKALSGDGAARESARRALSDALDGFGEKRLEETGASPVFKKLPDVPRLIKRAAAGLAAGAEPDGARRDGPVPDNGAGKLFINKIISQFAGPLREKLLKTIRGVKVEWLSKILLKSIDEYNPDAGASGLWATAFGEGTGGGPIPDKIEATVRVSVNEAIRRKLNSYGDDELSDLARSFFGQLKHIIALGGVLGALIGAVGVIITSVFGGGAQNSPLHAVTLTQVAVSVPLLAVIGWITNVVALEMLFRPRRDIKLGRFTFKSVISGNKERFAKAVGRFLAELTEDAGNGEKTVYGVNGGISLERMAADVAGQVKRILPELVRASVNDHAEDATAGHGDGEARLDDVTATKTRLQPDAVIRAKTALRKAGLNNAERISVAIIDNILKYLKPSDAAEEPQPVNVADGEQPANAVAKTQSSETAEAVRISGMADIAPPSGTPDETRRRSDDGAEGGGDWLSGALAAALNVDIPIARMLPDVGTLETAIRDRLYGLDAIETRRLFRHAVKSAYENILKPAAGARAFADRDKLRGALINFFNGPALPNLIKRLSQKTERRSNVGGGGAFSEGLFGALREACESRMPRICAAVRRRACAELEKNGASLAGQFIKSVNEHAGYLASMALRVTEGDVALTRAAEHFIAVQIPAFAERRAGEIDAAIIKLVRYALDTILSTRFLRRYFSVDAARLADILIEMARDERLAEAAADAACDVICGVFDGVGAGEAADLLGFGSADEALARADALIRHLSENLTENIRIEAEDLAKAAALYIKDIADASESRLTVTGVFGGVRSGDLSVLTESLRDTFFRADRLETIWKRGAYALLLDKRDAAQKALASAIVGLCGGGPAPEPAVKQSPEPAVRQSPEPAGGQSPEIAAGLTPDCDEKLSKNFDGDLSPELAGAAEGLIRRAAGRFDELWAGEFAEGVSSAVSEASVGAFAAGMNDLLRSADLQAVAERRINEMDTFGIERVFRSFAGRYIKRLKLYGLWGGLFGFHPVLPFATAFMAFVKYVTNKINTNRGGNPLSKPHGR